MTQALNNGSDIKVLRNQLRLSQLQFWEPLGVTQSGGSRYESGRGIPRPVLRLLQLAYGTQEAALAALNDLRCGVEGKEIVLAEPKPRTIIHLEVGSKKYTPSEADLQHITELFNAATVDPEGGVVATADGTVKATLTYYAQKDGVALAVASVEPMK